MSAEKAVAKRLELAIKAMRAVVNPCDPDNDYEPLSVACAHYKIKYICHIWHITK